MKQENEETGQPTRLPIPDPTVLTTEALRRDIGALRELLEGKITAEHLLTAQMLQERELRYEQRFTAQERAVDKQGQDYAARFSTVNEFRSQLSDQAATFMPRQEYQVQHDSLIERVAAGDKALSDRIDVNFRALSDRIEANSKGLADAVKSLELSRAGGAGEKTGRLDFRTAIAVGISVLVGLAGLIFGVVAMVHR